jgi:hypothetical protein
MKTIVILSLAVSFCAVAFAGDAPSLTKEPAALAKARKTYEAKIKAAVDPITAEYVKQLEKMKRKLGADGDVAGAQAVQREIDSLKGTAPIIGEWSWPNGDTVTVSSDGSFRSSSGLKGSWKSVSKKEHRYQLIWSTGVVDAIALSANGDEISGRNNQGVAFSSRRVN